jgi:hypothetical protein
MVSGLHQAQEDDDLGEGSSASVLVKLRTSPSLTVLSSPGLTGLPLPVTAVLIRVDPAANGSQRGRTNLQYLQALRPPELGLSPQLAPRACVRPPCARDALSC